MSTQPSPFDDQSRVWVREFSRQVEGDETIIAHPDVEHALVLPREALEILDALRAGATVADAARGYAHRHGEVPDVAGLLAALDEAGFVKPRQAGEEHGAFAARPRRSAGRAFVSTATARRLCSRPVLILCGLLVLGGGLAWLRDPGVVPSWDDLYLAEHSSTHVPALLVFYALAVAAHEAAHVLAARAAGVVSRVGLGTRLWVLVAETDMSGMWALPRRQRYLAFLAGPLLDLTCAAALVLVLTGHRQAAFALSPGAAAFLRAAFLVYMVSLLWQCYFFVRTDFYYVLANALGCRNLMGDTEAYLRSLLLRAGGRPAADVLGPLPLHERRVVRAYAPAWVAGRVLALYVLLYVQLPLLASYLVGLGTLGAAGPGLGTRLALLASLVLALGGLGLWVRRAVRTWR